jgi:hypothetical protein
MPSTQTKVIEPARIHPEMVDRPPPLALFILVAVGVALLVWFALWSLAYMVPDRLNRDLDQRWIQLNQPLQPLPPPSVPTPSGQ